MAARVREMRADRVAQVLAGETPVPLIDRPGRSVLHVIPLAAADPTPRPVNLDHLHSQTNAWFPWATTGYDERRNFDGFVTYSAAEGATTKAYIQVFRSGMVEVVAAGTVHVRDGTRTVWANDLATNFLNQVLRLLPALRQAEVDAPYSVQLTLCGVRGAPFVGGGANTAYQLLHPPLPVDRDVLSFVDALVGVDDFTPDQVAAALRPTLDQLFQTAAYETTPWFNADGSLKVGR